MHELNGSARSPHFLDEFICELLGAGAVLSQIISQMAHYAAAAEPTPDTLPIPDAAHEALASALSDLKHRYSRRDWKVAAGILKEATDRICQDVYFVPLDAFQDLGVDGDTGGARE